MDRTLISLVASAATTHVVGEFQRHTSPQYRTLSGSRGGGRWGPPGAFPVIYLGRPTASIVAEAYRHLVDVSSGMTGDQVGPRLLLTCDVSASNVLDVREVEVRDLLGLTTEDLTSFDYTRCQAIGAAAHQLGLSGVLAPAATGLGETLALFELNLAASEQPRLTDREIWAKLPADPRPEPERSLVDDLMSRRPRRAVRSEESESDEEGNA